VAGLAIVSLLFFLQLSIGPHDHLSNGIRPVWIGARICEVAEACAYFPGNGLCKIEVELLVLEQLEIALH
jgi:hypothetical protein